MSFSEASTRRPGVDGAAGGNTPVGARCLAKYRHDENGATAIIFGLGLMVLLACAGGAVDFGRVYSARSAVQAASDAAALAMASLAEKDPQKVKAFGESYFKQNWRGRTPLKSVKIDYESIAEGSARVTATAAIPTTLLAAVGFDELNLSVVSEAAVGGGSYLDLHILIDISGSMNIADGPAEMAKLASAYNPYSEPVGCEFACHRAEDPATGAGLYLGKTGFQIAQENGVYLRENRIKDAMKSLVSALEASPSANKFRVSLRTLDGNRTLITDVTDDYAKLKGYVDSIVSKSDGTIIYWHLPDIHTELGAPGPGTKADPRGAVLLVTDGVDYRTGNSVPYGFEDAKCQDFKDSGYEVFVLNIKYPDPALLHGAGSKATKTAAMLPSIQTSLQACASSGRYFEADWGSTIDDRLRQDCRGHQGRGRPAPHSVTVDQISA